MGGGRVSTVGVLGSARADYLNSSTYIVFGSMYVYKGVKGGPSPTWAAPTGPEGHRTSIT